jgi:hypothetical protein
MKTFKEFILESDTPNMTTGAGVATRDTVMGVPSYRIPHAAYIHFTQGKKRGQKWKDLIDDSDLTSELKKRLYTNKATMLVCDEYPEKSIFLKMQECY